MQPSRGLDACRSACRRAAPTPAVDPALRHTGTAAFVSTATALILLAVLAFGWIEDVAARRRVKLVPGGRRGR